MGVGELDLVDEVGQVVGGKLAGYEACGGAGGDCGEEWDGDQAGDAEGSSAYGHADGDFAAALLDGIVEDAVEADGG